MKSIEIEIKELDDEGRGVGFFEGRPLVVPFTIPGETIRLERDKIPKEKPRAYTGRIEFRQASPDRTEPPCPYYQRCGGCQLQHMTYERQLVEKENWLRRLAEGAVENGKIRPVIAAPQDFHYRRRVQFQIGPQGEVGFFGFHSQKVVGIDACLLAQDPINQSIPTVREMAREILASPRRPTLLSFEVTTSEVGKVQINPSKEERSFLQVNPGANQKLISFLQSVLQENPAENVLELFAGEGNLTFPLAGTAKQWAAVESNPTAVAKGKAKHFAPEVRWIEADVPKFLIQEAKRERKWDMILLDPPREGAKDTMAPLIHIRPSRIIYVSCNPRTLIRDLRTLEKGGYEVEILQPFDFFPQTMHLETVAILKK